MPTSKHVRLDIYNEESNCIFGCGSSGISRAEIDWLLIIPLKEEYGDSLNVRYFDVGKDNIDPQTEDYLAIHNYLYPALIINGEIVNTSYISYYDIASRLNKIFNAVEH